MLFDLMMNFPLFYFMSWLVILVFSSLFISFIYFFWPQQISYWFITLFHFLCTQFFSLFSLPSCFPSFRVFTLFEHVFIFLFFLFFLEYLYFTFSFLFSSFFGYNRRCWYWLRMDGSDGLDVWMGWDGMGWDGSGIEGKEIFTFKLEMCH